MRKKTKDYILDISLELFNESGLDAVSTRQIAQKAGISQGNLCYHYPQKEQIVEALYYRLVEEVNILVSNASDFSFEKYFASANQMCLLQNKYKFLMLSFVQVMRNFSVIKSHYQQLFEIRKIQFTEIYKYLEKKELLVISDYDYLINHSYIIGDFWIAEAEILFKGSESEKIKHYTNLIAGVIFPYLTDKGKIDYLKAKDKFFKNN